MHNDATMGSGSGNKWFHVSVAAHSDVALAQQDNRDGQAPTAAVASSAASVSNSMCLADSDSKPGPVSLPVLCNVNKTVSAATDSGITAALAATGDNVENSPQSPHFLMHPFSQLACLLQHQDKFMRASIDQVDKEAASMLEGVTDH